MESPGTDAECQGIETVLDVADGVSPWTASRSLPRTPRSQESGEGVECAGSAVTIVRESKHSATDGREGKKKKNNGRM
jgi:hypothetical protein